MPDDRDDDLPRARRPAPPGPLARPVTLPAWAVLVAALVAVGVALAALGVGYLAGRGGGPGAADAPSGFTLRSADDFPSARRAIMGASTQEVNRLIGPPNISYLDPDGVVIWVYDVKGPPGGTMFLKIQNDRVFHVQF